MWRLPGVTELESPAPSGVRGGAVPRRGRSKSGAELFGTKAGVVIKTLMRRIYERRRGCYLGIQRATCLRLAWQPVIARNGYWMLLRFRVTPLESKSARRQITPDANLCMGLRVDLSPGHCQPHMFCQVFKRLNKHKWHPVLGDFLAQRALVHPYAGFFQRALHTYRKP